MVSEQTCRALQLLYKPCSYLPKCLKRLNSPFCWLLQHGLSFSEPMAERSKLHSSQIHSPLLGDKVDYGIGLSYLPARQPMEPDGPERQHALDQGAGCFLLGFTLCKGKFVVWAWALGNIVQQIEVLCKSIVLLLVLASVRWAMNARSLGS